MLCVFALSGFGCKYLFIRQLRCYVNFVAEPILFLSRPASNDPCFLHRSENKLSVTRYRFCLYNFPMKIARRVERVSSKSKREKALAIRKRVFVREQGVPEEIEMDRDDERAIHFLAFDSGKAVGTARLVIRQSSAKIGRMAVLKNYRGKGIGTKLLRRAIVTARRQGAQSIYLHAQVPVIGFYEALAFRCVGPVFEEAGIPHRKMVLAGQS
jgi:predicted GNAT family N-acyltransferase